MTQIDEIETGIFRINTPFPELPGGFSFNQYLVIDEQPLLFHTGGKALFPLVSAAIERVLPLDKLRYVAFSHYEADECGALNEFLARAPGAEAVCSNVAAMVSVNDFIGRPARGMSHGEALRLGKHNLVWQDTPHLPHAWECGYMFDETSRTLFCGDLFTQPGATTPPLTEGDILGPSEAFRGAMDYFSHSTRARAQLEMLAGLKPRTLACMHGSAWRGDGAKLLGALAETLTGPLL